jgi:hypothetical protein
VAVRVGGVTCRVVQNRTLSRVSNEIRHFQKCSFMHGSAARRIVARFPLSKTPCKTKFKGKRNVQGQAFWSCSCLPYDFEQIVRRPLGDDAGHGRGRMWCAATRSAIAALTCPACADLPELSSVTREAACVVLVMGSVPGLVTTLHVDSSETFQVLVVRFRPDACVRTDKSAVRIWQAPAETMQFQTVFDALEKPHGGLRSAECRSSIATADTARR